MEKVFVVSGRRTPIGALMGALRSCTAIELAAETARKVIAESGLDASQVEEVIYGNVIASGLKQSPARQVSILAGVPVDVPCWNLNKLCASGLKAVCIGALNVMAQQSEVVLCGGFESMSNAPGLLLKQRFGKKVGSLQIHDSVFHDGLEDAFTGQLMGVCGEKTAKQFSLTRSMQDDYCIMSYERALKAQNQQLYDNEIISIKTPQGLVTLDEEPSRFNKSKIPTISPVFDKSGQGTITGANASKINDGACSLMLASENMVQKHNLKPLVEIVGFADAEVAPIDFNIAPTKAIKKLLAKSNLTIQNIDYWEINEAFSVTPLVTSKLLEIDINKINVHGGAVSLGHPVGMSGARILLSLINVLKRNNGTFGIAAICNGGGGATAILVKNVI